jgi:hypothetical protein
LNPNFLFFFTPWGSSQRKNNPRGRRKEPGCCWRSYHYWNAAAAAHEIKMCTAATQIFLAQKRMTTGPHQDINKKQQKISSL